MLSIRIEEYSEGDLTHILEDASSYEMDVDAMSSMLDSEDSGYACFTAVIRETSPETWPLESHTIGYWLAILADCNDKLFEALGGWDHVYSSDFLPTPASSPVAFRTLELKIDESHVWELNGRNPREMRLRVWCRSEHAPEADRKYSSKAYAVDAWKNNPTRKPAPPLWVPAKATTDS